MVKGRSGKVARNINQELITVVEAISGHGVVLLPFVIYKGAGYYMSYYQHLNAIQCDN